jgi:hypothetical protein
MPAATEADAVAHQLIDISLGIFHFGYFFAVGDRHRVVMASQQKIECDFGAL